MKLKWTFSTRWLDEDHVMVSFSSEGKDHDIVLSTVEYVHFMELQQHFSLAFKDKIDTNIIKAYNE